MKRLKLPTNDGRVIETDIDLTFPSFEGFRPQKYTVPFELIWRLSEERLPWINSNPLNEQERLRTKCRVPFELK